jgi:hypothetical protein
MTKRFTISALLLTVSLPAFAQNCHPVRSAGDGYSQYVCSSTAQAKGRVVDASDSGGGYFNAHPQPYVTHNYKPYCNGAWIDCAYDSARNRTEANVR